MMTVIKNLRPESSTGGIKNIQDHLSFQIRKTTFGNYLRKEKKRTAQTEQEGKNEIVRTAERRYIWLASEPVQSSLQFTLELLQLVTDTGILAYIHKTVTEKNC